MRLALFFPELALRETRTVIVRTPMMKGDRLALPADEYGLDEMYCVESGCDCRRVIINVVARGAMAQVATINHAFEPPTHVYDPPAQTFLDPLNVQSPWSPALLEMFVDVVLGDEAYRQRLLRHYRMFKDVVDNPNHPCHGLIAAPAAPSRSFPPPRRGRRRRG